MTNGERFKGAKERAEAFWNWYKGFNLPHDAVEAFADWLDLEAPAEEPLPCPFCGGATRCAEEWNGLFRVVCNKSDCWYSANIHATMESAIAAHNRVARAAKEKEANDANALIAAAPALYEALRYCVNFIGGAAEPLGADCETCEKIAKAKAALAAASGESEEGEAK